MNTLSNAQLNDVSGGPIPVIVWYVGGAVLSAIGGAAAGYLAGTSQTVTVTNTMTCNAPAPAQQ